MSKAPKTTRDTTGLYIREGDRKIYLTNPEKWQYSNGGELVVARVGAWSSHWTATWCDENDKGEASSHMVQWLMDNTKSAPMIGKKNSEKRYEEGPLFRDALVASALHVIETEGGLSGRATDEFIAQYNACMPNASEHPDDERGHYVKQGASKTYLVDVINPEHELWLFQFGPTGGIHVAASARTREDALDEATDWIAEHEPKYAPDPDLLTKDKGRLRSFMRREGMRGSFDDLSGKDQDIVLERMAKDYVECSGGYMKKKNVREKHLKAGPLRRKLLDLSDHMENHDEDEVDDTEALAALYGRSGKTKKSVPRRSSKPTKKRGSKKSTKVRTHKPKAPPKRRKLRGVVRRSD